MIREIENRNSPEHVYEIAAGHLKAVVSNLGASLRSLSFKGVELTLGHRDDATYLQRNDPYFATTVGRFGNRIGDGVFTLDGTRYSLARNNGKNHLHGGPKGFHVKYWQAEPVTLFFEGTPGAPASKTKAEGVRFSLKSPDGDEGYPGALDARVDILLSENDELFFAYRVESDAPTVANLTNHAYWNMNGEGSGSIHDNVLRLYTAGHLEVDASSIPTGTLVPLAGGPYDFGTERPIAVILSKPGLSGSDIPETEVRGVDHNFVLDPETPSIRVRTGDGELSLRKAAEVGGKAARMEVWTSMPGVQVYSANYLRGIPGRKGPHQIHAGLCLETQRFPDAPNQAAVFKEIGKKLGFAAVETDTWDAVLRPGAVDRSLTLHRFA